MEINESLNESLHETGVNLVDRNGDIASEEQTVLATVRISFPRE
jgi:hypothetical protein